MSKLIELPRAEFLHEITENWSKWEKPTTIKELAQYMVDNAFTKKAIGTLEKTPKKQLREIIIKGDEDVTHQDKKSPGGLGGEVMDFLDDVKIEMHKKNIHPTIKKQIIKQIDKQAEKVEDDSIFDKLGIFSLVVLGIMLVLEMVFPNGFKDTIKKYKEFKNKKTLDAEVVKD